MSDDWRAVLLLFKQAHPHDQGVNRSKIVSAFKGLLCSSPTEQEFVKYTDGLILFPEMIYQLTLAKK